MSPPTPNTDAALVFLNYMFDASVLRHLVAIGETGKVAARSFEPNEVEGLRAWVEARQTDANIYYSVNALKPTVRNRKAKKEDVELGLHLHVDVDDPSALDRIREFMPKPTAIVFSGGGYQAFWKLKEPTPDLARVECINAELARRLGGDNCHNIDRIMRLPGTINVPNAKKRKAGRVPTLAYVVEEATDWSRLYSLDDFDDPPPAAPAAALQAPREVEPVDQLPKIISVETRELVERGDDPSNPIGSENAHFPSRSEAVWRVACDLARAGC
jgi:RepB DNA-primase from phage plasmid